MTGFLAAQLSSIANKSLSVWRADVLVMWQTHRHTHDVRSGGGGGGGSGGGGSLSSGLMAADLRARGKLLLDMIATP